MVPCFSPVLLSHNYPWFPALLQFCCHIITHGFLLFSNSVVTWLTMVPCFSPGPASHMDERTREKKSQLQRRVRMRNEQREHNGGRPHRGKNKGTANNMIPVVLIFVFFSQVLWDYCMLFTFENSVPLMP